MIEVRYVFGGGAANLGSVESRNLVRGRCDDEGGDARKGEPFKEGGCELLS